MWACLVNVFVNTLRLNFYSLNALMKFINKSNAFQILKLVICIVYSVVRNEF